MNQIMFLGCGSANMFAIMYLLDHGYGGDIVVIDSGKSPYDRDRGRDGLVKGFAGAGLWSDGKLVFSEHPDLTVTSLEDRRECHNYIRSVVSRFTSGFYGVGISPKRPESELMKYGIDRDEIELLQSDVYHLGTQNNVLFGKRVYDYMVSKGVKFAWDATATEIDMENKWILIGNKDYISYDNLQIGVGKSGVNFVNSVVAKNGIRKKSGAYNIGFRFECDYNDKIDSIARNLQYDFKFFRQYSDRVSLRTFCTNNYSAEVIREKVERSNGSYAGTFNGHAYGFVPDRKTNLTNFGIIARIFLDDTTTAQNDMLNRVPDEGMYIVGENGIPNNDVLGTIGMKQISLSEIDGIIGISGIHEYFDDFIRRLDNILGFDGRWIGYFPEVKMASGVILTNKCYTAIENPLYNSLLYPEVSWVGDAVSGSVGIVPSAVTGIMGVKKFVKG